MRCKTCDYPLWNLTTRVCPECGTPFLPSQFDITFQLIKLLNALGLVESYNDARPKFDERFGRYAASIAGSTQPGGE